MDENQMEYKPTKNKDEDDKIWNNITDIQCKYIPNMKKQMVNYCPS